MKVSENNYKRNAMKVLGIHLQKEKLYYAVIEGSKSSPVLVEKERLCTVSWGNVPEFMDWFETHISQIISTHSPDKISYRLTLDPKKEQLFTLIMPLGILNLLAHKENIPTKDYTARSYTPSKLGLSRGLDLYSYCDSIFGTPRPYWDKNMKNAILAGWFEL